MKVNIIGAGISGLTAGCYLQMNGIQTEIFEKHSIPGGLCTSWNKGEYTFDGCLHWLLGTDKGSSFYQMWSEFLDMKNIPFVNHEVRVSVELKNTKNKYGEKTFHLYTNLEKLEEYMTDLSPEDSKTIKEFIRPMRIMQKYDLPPIMDELPFFQSIIRSIKMIRYLEFLFLYLKIKNETNYTFAKRFKSQFLKESIEMLFDGEEMSLIVILMPLSCFASKSAGYPIGGSLRFAQRIEESYLRLGGKINYNTPVHKVIVEDDISKGLLVRNNVKHISDYVISSADWNFTVFNLLEGKYLDDKMRQLKDLKGFELFYSILMVSFGINSDMSEYPHLLRFPLDEMLVAPDGTEYERIEAHIYNYDPTLAPKGKTVLTVSFYTKNADYWIDLRRNDRPKYREVKREFTEKVLTIIDKRYHIKDKVEETDFGTPATVFRYTNSWKGSTQGWLPDKNIMARPPVGLKLPELKKFYYSSHWNRPGGGLPIAVTTGRDVAKAICKEIGIKFQTKKNCKTVHSV